MKLINLYIFSNIKNEIKHDEINGLATTLGISLNSINEIIDTYIAIGLFLFTRSDFREHLKFSEIITRNASSKKQVDKTKIIDLLNNNEISDDANELINLLFKKNNQTVLKDLDAKYGITQVNSTILFELSIKIIILKLNQIIRTHKINIGGLIRTLEKEEQIINKHIPSSTQVSLREISANNRKRNQGYRRGAMPKTDYYAIFYPILIVSIIVSLYIYYYYNLL